jgi:ABC-type multidrug transport system fused ATPase/permease subunit
MSVFDAAKAINEGVWLVATLALALASTGGGAEAAGQITAIVLLYAGVTQPLGDLHRIIDEAAESAQQTTDLFNLLDEPVDVSYSRAGGAPMAVNSRWAVELEGVRFDYCESEDKSIPVLRGLDLGVAPGERLGLVGPSGCGKSTALRLICGLVHAQAGGIRVNGRDIRDLSREELVRTVGYVPQHPQIFRMSVLENILLAAPDATRLEAERAARRAHLHEDIVRLRDGYDTLVSERGETLSGGQRQRLALARALVCTPPILLLDEATSALDEEAQARVSEAVAALQGITLIVVAHRVSTLRAMDRIVELDQGRADGAVDYAALVESTA